jgi:hypothetical protein
MFRIRTARLSCALLALSVGPGFATVVTYSDITAWQAATAAGFSTITFDNFTNQQFTTGLSIGGTFFSSSGQLWSDFQNPGPSNTFNFGSGTVLESLGGNFTITLPASFTSVGFDIMTSHPNGATASGINFLATLNGTSTVYTSTATLQWVYPNPTRAFLGFTSDSPITQLILGLPSSASGVDPLIDNFSFGTAASAPAQTPEACTLLLIGAGLVGMRLFRRRLRKAAEAGRSGAAPAVPYRRPLATASTPTG